MANKISLSLFLLFPIFASSIAVAQEENFWSNFQLNGDEKPNQTPWTEAASLAFTSGEGNENKAIDISLRYDQQLSRKSDSTAFIRFLTHVNDNPKKEQEFYKGSIGYHFEYGGEDLNDILVFSDIAASFQRKTIFSDPDDIPQCTTNPNAIFCDEQFETSARLSFDTAIHPAQWESDAPSLYDTNNDGELEIVGRPFLYSFSPVVTIFYDEVLDATTNPENGVLIDGSAIGIAATIGGSISPNFLDYRLEFKSSYKLTSAFQRSESRKPGFDANSDLFKASVNYNFGKTPYLKETGWTPAIGISYSSGADPLSGRDEKEETVIGFKLSHKSK